MQTVAQETAPDREGTLAENGMIRKAGLVAPFFLRVPGHARLSDLTGFPLIGQNAPSPAHEGRKL